ncbi:MAG: hypothetical protein O2931_16285, partial [Planctomycetota bacterium]|nr:hypothetical protein [Planctomycetota bacterium]
MSKFLLPVVVCRGFPERNAGFKQKRRNRLPLILGRNRPTSKRSLRRPLAHGGGVCMGFSVRNEMTVRPESVKVGST